MTEGGKGKHRGGRRQNGRPSDLVIEGHAASYVQKYVRCGKERCKRCKNGPGHGPYWYRVWRDDNGKVRTRYAGRVEPGQEQKRED